jgi:hypothetical protein
VAQQFAFGDEHRWANLRMIRIGGYTGVGFGNSSPQKAGIALNTIQADSTYAFYIASEHGAWGGVFLLLARGASSGHGCLAPLARIRRLMAH